jgi:hypothetical protein
LLIFGIEQGFYWSEKSFQFLFFHCFSFHFGR